MSLIKRDALHINLIHFELNMTNRENYRYYNNFKVDVVGGFYAIDDVNIFKKYLQKISEKHINKPFIDSELRYTLESNAMDKYLVVLTGER